MLSACSAARVCDNWINALKLLANQQKDCQSPIQIIVTGLHKTTRKGIMDGPRSFITEDNHRAVDVGHSRKGIKPFHVRKPKFSEAYPEAAIREGADELTLQAEEVRLQRAFIDTKHMELERWRPLPVDSDWHVFCQAIYTGIEERMRRAVLSLQRVEPGDRSQKAE